MIYLVAIVTGLSLWVAVVLTNILFTEPSAPGDVILALVTASAVALASSGLVWLVL